MDRLCSMIQRWYENSIRAGAFLWAECRTVDLCTDYKYVDILYMIIPLSRGGFCAKLIITTLHLQLNQGGTS